MVKTLSPRGREVLGVTFLSLLLTVTFAATPYYQVAELKFYDFRLLTWSTAPVSGQDDLNKVRLYTKRDSTVEQGFDDLRLLELMERFSSLGSRIVVLGADLFDDYEAIAEDLPEGVIVLDDSQGEAARRALFRDPVNLEQFENRDGVLRSLPWGHPALNLWTELRFELTTELVHLKPMPEYHRTGSSLGESDLPLENLAELWSAISLDTDLYRNHARSWSDKILLFQKGKTTASEVAEVAAPGGEYTAGQIHLMIHRALADGWTVRRPGASLSLAILAALVSLYTLVLWGRRPVVLAVAPILSLPVLGVGSFSLLPAGLDAPVVLFCTGIFWATALLVLSKIVKGRRLLHSFGGAEDADFEGEESVASMVFTNLPPYLLEMERKHDQGLLRFRRDYNEVLAGVARRYHGKVLDYQGDAQMLGFGLRHDEDTDHAAEATAAALEIVREVQRLAELWRVPAEAVQVHAGVCTGTIALGHLGATQKQDIAAIGDTTNTAARLMGAAMKLKVGVLIAKSTAGMAGELIEVEELPPVELKGKSAPVEVFHARSVSPVWKLANLTKGKDAVSTSGTLSYKGSTESDLLVTLALAFCGLVLTVVVWRELLLEGLELEFFDRVHQTVGEVEADPSIVLIGIDDESASDPALGGFPFNRGIYAAALENLRETEVRGVFIDVLFKAARDPRGDRYLARVIESDPRVVVAGVLHRNERNRLEPPRFFPAVDAGKLQSRRQIGLIHNKLDEDGKTRTGFISLRETASHGEAEKEKRGVFPAAAAALLLGPEDEFAVTDDSVRVGEREIYPKFDSQGNSAIRVRFGPPATGDGEAPTEGSYEVVSFRRLLDPDDPIFSRLDGKYLLIGQTMTGGQANEVDRVDTVVGRIKGVEVHARVLDNLLNDNYFRLLSPGPRKLSVLVVAALTLWILVRYREPKAYLSRLMELVVMLFFLYLACFVVLSYVFELAVLYLTVALVSICVLTGRNILTFNALSRVVPTEVALELLFRSQASDRRQVATVLLTDIRGYTTLSEGRTAVAMLDALNEYHKRTVACYARYGGQALTYQGDAQIVVFGVFGKRPNPAADAAAAALELQSICDQLRAVWGIRSRDDFDVGAGLCTGEVEVGWLGGAGNLQYSVVGETVRKAHKVQSLSADLEAPVIMDEETYRATNGQIQADDLGLIQPKGLPHEIRLYRARAVAAQETFGAKRTGGDDEKVNG